MTEKTRELHARRGPHGFWFGIALGGVLGVAIGGAALAAAHVSSAPMPFKAHHGRFGGHGLEDPEKAKEHLGLAAQFVLSRLEASDAQTAEVQRILERTIDALVPLTETHRANRESLVEELTAPSIDRGAIERVRESEVQLAETLSREITTALADVAETLTPEQRAEILEMAHRFHR